MEHNQALDDFMDMIGEDPRIGPSHVSLFLAILHACKQQAAMPLSVFSRDLMKQAKISSVGTYHKCLKDLKEYGYIRYRPSFNPALGSEIDVV